MLQWKNESRAVGALKPCKFNPRKIDESQLERLKESVEASGYNAPILIDTDNTIIAGHQRWFVLNELGHEKVDVRVPSRKLTEQEFKRINIQDNVPFGQWDMDVLEEHFELQDLIDWGMDESFFSDFFKDQETELDSSGTGDSVPDVPIEPTTKRGDIYILGEHRLLCGDSTSITDVQTLMNGQTVDMVYTDPPYGINEETDRAFESRTRLAKGNTFDKIIGDDSIDTAVNAYGICATLAPIICYWGGNYYAHKLPPSPAWIVWDKRVEENQRDMNSDCELAYVKHPTKKSIRIFRHLWKGMIKASETGQARVHPTQKPIALAEYCIKELAPNAKSIVDLFGGSGSTLIACELMGIKCFMMEMEPQYCDVIVQRWEEKTGKKATLERNNS